MLSVGVQLLILVKMGSCHANRTCPGACTCNVNHDPEMRLVSWL